MEDTVNMAANQGATAGFANESASDFAFPAEPAAQPAAAPATQSAGQKDAGAVDAQRSADARGNEPRRDFPNRFQNARPQKDIGKAFDKESDRVRTQAQREYEEKLAADPQRKLAELMISDVMRSKGITMEQALQEIENGFYASIAEREGVSVGMARLLYAQGQNANQSTVKMDNPVQEKPQNTQQQPQSKAELEAQAEAEANEILDELVSMQMPEGFDLVAAASDQAFVDLLAKYPTDAAVRIYHAEQRAQNAATEAQKAPQQVADQLRSRAAVPQSTRSSAVAGPPDFKHMSRDDYKKYQKEHNLT